MFTNSKPILMDDVDRLMASTDPNLVHLLFDTGHIYYAGGDPLSLAQKHASRIKHVHLKNIRPKVLADALTQKLSGGDPRGHLFGPRRP